jgi:aspartyl/asparaginyl-tRNA synthetase
LPPPDLSIGEVRDHIDERVIVRGWLDRVRRSKDLYRLELRDRSGLLEALWEPGSDSGDPPPPESVVRATGLLRGANGNPVQLQIEELEVVALAQSPLPMGPGAPRSQELDARHLELRSASKYLIFAVQTTLEAAIREFVLARGFVEIHSPKISGGGSESGATVFSVPYFGNSAYLVQSPQFYMQMAMAAGFERAFEIGPVFRNEPGSTPIHATEFTIAHFEMSWIDSHEDLIDFEEALLRHAVAAVAAEHGEKIEKHCGVTVDFPAEEIPRLPISEAQDLVGEAAVGDERSLSDLERALSKRAHREHGHGLVFLTDYPASERPFYTMVADEAPAGGPLTSRSFDLLWHGIEITSGGQREHRFDRLERNISGAGLTEEAADLYIRPHFLEMFRYGCPPHGGFGIGINRLLMAILGQSSIKDTSFVFRGPKRYMP